MNHAAYQKSLKSKTDAQLLFIRQDAQQAIQAMPNGHKAGYYADEINYTEMELAHRSKKRNS